MGQLCQTGESQNPIVPMSRGFTQRGFLNPTISSKEISLIFFIELVKNLEIFDKIHDENIYETYTVALL